MNQSKVANLVGASIFFVAAVAHAQTPRRRRTRPLRRPLRRPSATDAQAPATPPAGVAAPVAPPAEAVKPASKDPVPVTSKWKATIYGMAEFDIMHDSTQSFGESVGATVIQREDTYAGSHGRTHFTARNSRFGVKVSAPEVSGIKATAMLELDFFGNQPPTVSEASLVSSGTFRLRQANIKVESDYVDLLIGQGYPLFGWQPYFFPAATSFFPVMNQVFGRMPQLRVGHNFKGDAASVELAAAVLKPPRARLEVPDMQAGLRVGFNGWKGITARRRRDAARPADARRVLAFFRKFRVNEHAAAPVESSSANGYGISVDALLPIIPAKSLEESGNALTLTGSFFTGTGISDVVGVASNVPHPALPEEGRPIRRTSTTASRCTTRTTS